MSMNEHEQIDALSLASCRVVSCRDMQVEALVGKRKHFFSYLKKTHEEGGFWLNCVQLTRQVG